MEYRNLGKSGLKVTEIGLGGNNFGIETCWLNTTGASVDERIAPNYTVESLSELKNILVA